MLRVVHDSNEHGDAGRDDVERGRLAAREMIAVALEAERRAYLEARVREVDAVGRRVVVGNGYAREREITTAAGRVEVRALESMIVARTTRSRRRSCRRACAGRRR